MTMTHLDFLKALHEMALARLEPTALLSVGFDVHAHPENLILDFEYWLYEAGNFIPFTFAVEWFDDETYRQTIYTTDNLRERIIECEYTTPAEIADAVLRFIQDEAGVE